MVRRKFQAIENDPVIYTDSATDLSQALSAYEVATAKILKSKIYVKFLLSFYCRR